MAKASAHHKQMENLMYPEIPMKLIKTFKFKCIDHTADSVDHTAHKQPYKAYFRHGRHDLGQSQTAKPAKSYVNYGRDPLRVMNPKHINKYT